MTRTCRRAGALAAFGAAAALGLAACSGGASPPQVASLGKSSGPGAGNSAGSGHGRGNSTAARPAGNPARLLNEWAACMRHHGDPSQVDPTIDANKDIQISMTNVSPALSAQAHGSTGPCGSYLVAASSALRGGQPAPRAPSLAVQLKYAECMRANGVPGYPDPNGRQDQSLGKIDTNSATFQNADKTCSQRTGEPYSAPGTEAPGVVVVRSCNAPPGRQCPAGFPGANGGSGASG